MWPDLGQVCVMGACVLWDDDDEPGSRLKLWGNLPKSVIHVLGTIEIRNAVVVST